MKLYKVITPRLKEFLIRHKAYENFIEDFNPIHLQNDKYRHWEWYASKPIDYYLHWHTSKHTHKYWSALDKQYQEEYPHVAN